MRRTFAGLYRDDPRQPQPRKPRAPRPKKAPPTLEQKRAAKLVKARAMLKAWQRRLKIATGRFDRWTRRVAALERQAAIDAAVARAIAAPSPRVRRKITLEGS